MFFIPGSHAVTTETETLEMNRTLNPVTGEWYYDERNSFIDFEEYYESSSPNLTIGSQMDESDITGVFKKDTQLLKNNYYDDQKGPDLSELSNLSIYVDDNHSTQYYNISTAILDGNIAIPNNNTIKLQGNYRGNQTFRNENLWSAPNYWIISGTGTITTVYEQTNRNYIMKVVDPNGAAQINGYYPMTGLTQGYYEFAIYFTDDDLTQIGLSSAAIVTNSLMFQSSVNWEYNDGAVKVLRWHVNSTNIVKTNNIWWRVLIYYDIPGGYWNCYLSKDGHNYQQVENNLGNVNLAFRGAPAAINYCFFLTSNAAITTYYVDSIDGDFNIDYSINRISVLENMVGNYISDVIDFQIPVIINNIEVNITQLLDNDLQIYISDNLTTDFTNWFNYSVYSEITQFVKYKIVFECNNASFANVFSNLTFIIVDEHIDLSPLLNPNDKYLLISPVKNWTMYPHLARFQYNLSMNQETHFTVGEIEMLFVHVFYPDFSTGAISTSFYFNPYVNNKLTSNLFITYNAPILANKNARLSIQHYSGVNFWNTKEYFYHNSTTHDFYFMIYDVVINYKFNAEVNYIVSYYNPYTDKKELFIDKTYDIYNDTTHNDIEQFEMRIHNDGGAGGPTQQYTRGQSLMICNIDSSRMRADYQRFQCLEVVVKNLTTNNVEDFLVIKLPQKTSQMDSFSISQVQVKSSLPRSDFIDFICEIYDERFINLDNYVTIDSDDYKDKSFITINPKYRCKNLNTFNNTIIVKVTYIYVPRSNTLIDMMVLAIPTVLMLIIPSSAAYIKFKRTGFLMVFFLMTLITTILGWLPLIPGLIMMTCLVIIFIKLMQNDNQSGGN